ncbi:MAG: hypothetical protein ACUVUQ_06855 [Thermodesulfovibrionales bacterium]
MDYEKVKENAIVWMINRNWKRCIAKRREFEQSLFEHSMVELDAIIHLLPILRKPQHFNLSEDEEKVLLASIIVHDVGKEKKEWQEYILGKSGFVSDIDPKLTRQVVFPLCDLLGFSGLEEKIIQVIENCVNLHMKHERTDAKVMAAILTGTDRWKTLADIVDAVDNFCSAQGAFVAISSIEKSFLANHLKVTYHQVNIRGVSTIFLHKAAVDSFIVKGWTPLLCYGNSTIYICSAADNFGIPTIEEIKKKLSNIINEAIGKDVTDIMVGSPVGNILPKPDLFDHTETKKYLVKASQKIGKKNYWKKGGELKEEGRKVIERYLKLKGCSAIVRSKDINIQSQRISSAHPEMVIFKFFKAMMSEYLIGKKGEEIAKREYEDIFGKDSWKKLQRTSTLMPAQDMANTVDLFWSLPGERFGLRVGTIEELSDDKRTELLIDILYGIATKVYKSIPDPPSRSKLSMEMAEAFMNDLIKPPKEINIEKMTKTQLEAYSKSKPFAGKETKKGEYLCPICNTPFKEGIKASADFLDNPQSHTNRGLSHCAFGYVLICNTCKYERFLRQIILEGKPSELIYIFPRMNIGYGSGNILVQRVKELYEMAYNLMIGNNEDPFSQISLPLTQLIARKALDKDLFNLSPKDIVDILTYQTKEDTRKKQRKQLEKQVKEKIGQTVDELNEEWGTDFSTFDKAIDALIAGKINDPGAIEIRKEVFRLTPQLQVVCQTPNMILMPVTYPIAIRDESETNSALRKIFISLLIGLSLDVTVAIVGNSDDVNFEGGEGVAYVSPVPAVRELIGYEWIPLSEAMAWFKAIGATSLLANDTGYPERSNLFSILSAQTPGHILRRLEEKLSEQNRQIMPYHINYLETVREVLK